MKDYIKRYSSPTNKNHDVPNPYDFSFFFIEHKRGAFEENPGQYNEK